MQLEVDIHLDIEGMIYYAFYKKLVIYVVYANGHCVLCPSSIYEFWLPILVSSNFIMVITISPDL